MFEKLLSQLPYNPGLAQQMSFYSRRMREEASIRRIGMIFIVLAFFVQFFAVLSPPQSTIAASSNDLINGGISSAADAAQHCNNNTQHYKNILDNYGITCTEVANARTVTINATGQNYYSFGNNQQGFSSEQPVNIPNDGRIYIRKLSDWGPASYRALQLTAQSGKSFWILYQCGNLVSIGIPSPYSPQAGIDQHQAITRTGVGQNQAIASPAPAQTPAPTPTTPATPVAPTPPKNCAGDISGQNPTACLAIHKTAANTTQGLADANNTTAQSGDVIVYTLYGQNTGPRPIKGYVFQENLSDVLDYADVVSLHGGSMSANGMVSWPAQTITRGATVTEQITVKVKNPVPQTPVSASDPTHFDLIMTNVYGNTINISLPGSVGKSVEAAGASLPNTGPGSSLLVAAAILIVGGYFYSRSRLLAQESNVALRENTGA